MTVRKGRDSGVRNSTNSVVEGYHPSGGEVVSSAPSAREALSVIAKNRALRRSGEMTPSPQMKRIYEHRWYASDTLHRVIAVDPSHIETYESLLFFRRLTGKAVDDTFINAAPPLSRE